MSFLIISAASHAPSLVSFFLLQAFCFTNPHSSAWCQLPAATAGPPFCLCTLGFSLPALVWQREMKKSGVQRQEETSSLSIPFCQLWGKDSKEEVTFSLQRNHCQNEPLLLGGKESSHNPPHYFPSSILPLFIHSNWPLLATQAGSLWLALNKRPTLIFPL